MNKIAGSIFLEWSLFRLALALDLWWKKYQTIKIICGLCRFIVSQFSWKTILNYNGVIIRVCGPVFGPRRESSFAVIDAEQYWLLYFWFLRWMFKHSENEPISLIFPCSTPDGILPHESTTISDGWKKYKFFRIRSYKVEFWNFGRKSNSLRNF